MFPQIFGKYVLDREIASGGMARVFLATLRGAGGFEKRLVVKQIRPELASDQSFIGRFVAEAKTTVELSHGNIVPVYELGAEQGTYYIAMEYCEGVALSQLLTAGALSPEEGAYIGVEICRALDYAHRKAGIVHRDVTPRNVMIDPEGMVRLIDFGIAATTSAELAGSGPLFGSPGHMPPEQLRPGPLTPAADVFAVAVLLIETWSGRAPFRRESFEASARALLHGPIPDVAAIDARLAPLSALMASALALAPSKRPQTAEEFSRPLREFLRQSDLGDIARRLGQRVSEPLPRLSAAPPDPSSRCGVSLAAGPRATQTFAAREAVLEWTAKIESSATARSFRAACTSEAPRRRLTALRVAVAAGLLAVAGLGSLRSFSGSPESSGGARATELDLPGLSPVLAAAEGDAPELTPKSASKPADAQSAPELAAAPRAASSSVVGPGSTLGSRAPVLLTRVAAHPPAPPLGPAPPGRVASELRGAKAGAAALTPSGRGQLTAEPLAWVEVDGARVGRTPLSSFTLSAGRHEIVFVSELLGERLQATISVQRGAAWRVHADFTSATPQIYVR